MSHQRVVGIGLSIFVGLVTLAMVLLISAFVVYGAQQTPPDYKLLAAQRTDDLGRCHAELGPLQQLSAQVLAGRLVSIEGFKAAFEKANPGKTLSETYQVREVASP